MQILPLTALLLVSVSNLLAADTPATGDDLSAGEFAIWREGDNIALGDWTVTLHFAPGPVFSFNLRNPAVPYDVVLRSSPVSEDGMGRAYWNAGTNWSGSGQWGTGGVINTYKYFDSVKSKWLTFTYDWNGFVDLLMSSGPSNGTFTVPLPSGFSIGPFTVIGCQLNLTTAYDAYINDNTVVLLNQNATLTSLTVGGPEFPLTGLDFDGARTLVVQNTLHNRGIVDLFSQGVVKTGAIANFGTLRNFRGTVDGDFINHGQVDLATSLTTNGLFVTTGLLSVNGVLTVAGNQPATFGGQVVLHDAVLQTLTGSRISASSPLILGTGTLSITLSDGTVNIGGAGMPTALTLSGSVGQSGSYVISHGAQCLLNRSNLSNDGQIEVVGVGSVLRTTDNDFGGNNDWEASAGLLGKGRVLVKEGGLLELAANITDAHPSPVGWAQEHVHGRVENSVEIDAASKLVSRGSGHWNEIVGAVVNYGTIDVQQRLDLLGPVSSSGRVSIGNCLNIAGGQTAVLGGEVTLAGGSLQTSNGSGITATSPMVTGTGTVDATIQGGMMNVGGSGTSLVLKGKVEAGAGYRIVDGAQCLLNRSNLSNDGQIEVVGVGSVLRTTDNDFGGNNDWEASAGLLGKGRVLVKEGGLLELAANITDAHPSPVGWAQEHVHGRVENSVEIDAASKLVSRGSGHWNEIVGAVRNAGTVDVDHRLDVGAGLVNSGIVNVNDSLIVTGPLVNQGRITVNGALEYTEMVLDGGTVVAASLNVSSDREIRGIGRLQANVTNSGVVTPGSPFGTIEITGNYSQTGKLEAGIGSASPTDFGRVLVAGNASIGGTLDVNVLDGARFDAGGTFDLLTANAVAGQFSNIILPVGSSGLPLFSVSYLPNAVRLTALQTVAPPTGQWNAIATGDWGVRANWLGDLPNSVGAVASFPAIVAPSCAVTVGAPVIVGAINFPDVTACNVTGVGLLTMEVLVGRASIVSDGGLHTISVPIELASDADITVSKGTLTMSGSITNTTGRTLTKMGGGALVVNGRQTYEPAAALEVLAGAVSLESDAGAGGANLSVTVGAAGTAHFGSTQRLAGLSIVGGGAADLVAGHDKVMLVSSLAIDPAGKLDLADNAMIVQAAIGSRDSVLANIGQLIAAGRNKGAWNGTGIISSAAASSGLTGLAVMLNDRGDGVPLVTTFDGLSVGANSILVKFTWNGDANLDGIINADDYFQIDSGFISQKKGWYNGDLNYDGVVNADDYFLIDSAFIGQSGPLSAGHSRASAVPEPGALGLLLAGAATLITRRRRHHQPRPNRPDPPDLPDAGNLVHHADLSRRRVEI